MHHVFSVVDDTLMKLLMITSENYTVEKSGQDPQVVKIDIALLIFN